MAAEKIAANLKMPCLLWMLQRPDQKSNNDELVTVACKTM